MSSDNEPENDEQVEAALRDAAHHWEATAPEPPPFPRVLAAEPDIDADAEIISLGEATPAQTGPLKREPHRWLVAAVLLAVVGVGVSLLIPRGGDANSVALADPTPTVEQVIEEYELLDDAGQQVPYAERAAVLSEFLESEGSGLDELTFTRLSRNRFRIEACMQAAGVPFVGVPASETIEHDMLSTVDRSTVDAAYIETVDGCVARSLEKAPGAACADAPRDFVFYPQHVDDRKADETPAEISLKFGTPLQTLLQLPEPEVSELAELPTDLSLPILFAGCKQPAAPWTPMSVPPAFEPWPGLVPLDFVTDVDRSDIGRVAQVYLHDVWPEHIEAGYELEEPVIRAVRPDGSRWGYVRWSDPDTDRTGRLWLRTDSSEPAPVWEPFYAKDDSVLLMFAANRGRGFGGVGVLDPVDIGSESARRTYAGEFQFGGTQDSAGFAAFHQEVVPPGESHMDIAVVIEHGDPLIREFIADDVARIEGVRWVEGPLTDAELRASVGLGINDFLVSSDMEPLVDVDNAALISIDVVDGYTPRIDRVAWALGTIDEAVRVVVTPYWNVAEPSPAEAFERAEPSPTDSLLPGELSILLTPTPTPWPGQDVTPSQSPELAARDGVPPEFAALSTGERVDPRGEVVVQGQRWVASQVPVTAIDQVDRSTADDSWTRWYVGELLQFNDDGQIIRSIPLDQFPPFGIIGDDRYVTVYRRGDGGYPNSGALRVDTQTGEIERLSWPWSYAEDTLKNLGEWRPLAPAGADQMREALESQDPARAVAEVFDNPIWFDPATLPRTSFACHISDLGLWPLRSHLIVGSDAGNSWCINAFQQTDDSGDVLDIVRIGRLPSREEAAAGEVSWGQEVIGRLVGVGRNGGDVHMALVEGPEDAPALQLYRLELDADGVQVFPSTDQIGTNIPAPVQSVDFFDGGVLVDSVVYDLTGEPLDGFVVVDPTTSVPTPQGMNAISLPPLISPDGTLIATLVGYGLRPEPGQTEPRVEFAEVVVSSTATGEEVARTEVLAFGQPIQLRDFDGTWILRGGVLDEAVNIETGESYPLGFETSQTFAQ